MIEKKSAKKNICNLDLAELGEVLIAWGEKKFRARQIFSWIYQKGAQDFSRMSDLSSGLRGKLEANFYILGLALIKACKSSDETEKFLFELEDGNFIEAVSIPARGRPFDAVYPERSRRTQGRVTGCVSTQAGCKFRCNFCASGAAGFKRNLTSAEILNEIIFLKDKSETKKLTHIVFMGTGEPLDNYAQVLKAIRIINAKYGFNIAARRITISTCGLIPEIQKLAKEGLQIELSVSLHAADNKTRDLIMPVNKIYPIEKLIAACRVYFKETRRQVTFEYVLVRGLNSDLQNARNLGKILTGFDCKVNLIPANPVEELKIEPPGKKEILSFKEALLKEGIRVTLRKPRGGDINASCGQLRLQYVKE